MQIIFKKNGEAADNVAQVESALLEELSAALSRSRVYSAYALTVIAVDDYGPFVRATCRLFREEQGEYLQSNILEWRTGALKASAALALLNQEIIMVKPLVLSDYRSPAGTPPPTVTPAGTKN